MLTLDSPQWAHLDRLTVTDTTADPETGETTCKASIKVQVPLEPDQLGSVPVDADALKALTEESNGIREGKNTLKIAFKRDLGISHYRLSQHDGKKASAIAAFTGTVKGSPSISIVQGDVFAVWEIETLISPDMVGVLAGMVERDDLKLSCQNAQQNLPGLEVVA